MKAAGADPRPIPGGEGHMAAPHISPERPDQTARPLLDRGNTSTSGLPASLETHHLWTFWALSSPQVTLTGLPNSWFQERKPSVPALTPAPWYGDLLEIPFNTE